MPVQPYGIAMLDLHHSQPVRSQGDSYAAADSADLVLPLGKIYQSVYQFARARLIFLVPGVCVFFWGGAPCGQDCPTRCGVKGYEGPCTLRKSSSKLLPMKRFLGNLNFSFGYCWNTRQRQRQRQVQLVSSRLARDRYSRNAPHRGVVWYTLCGTVTAWAARRQLE